MTRLLSIVVCLAACGGGPKHANDAKPDVTKCPQVGDHLVGLMTTGKAANAPLEATDRVRNVLTQRCTDDGWGLDAQTCFLRLAKIEDSDRCAGFLTVPQREAADQAMADAFPESAPTPAGAAAPMAAPVEEKAPAKDAEPPKRSTRGAVPKQPAKTGDPCDGGE